MQVTWREREARNPSSPQNTAIFRHRTTALRTRDTSKCVCIVCCRFLDGGKGVGMGGMSGLLCSSHLGFFVYLISVS